MYSDFCNMASYCKFFEMGNKRVSRLLREISTSSILPTQRNAIYIHVEGTKFTKMHMHKSIFHLGCKIYDQKLKAIFSAGGINKCNSK